MVTELYNLLGYLHNDRVIPWTPIGPEATTLVTACA
jgi:hypothetical protein